MPTTRIDESSWKIGINNKAHPSKMPNGSLREAVNCFVGNSGMMTKRAGYTQKSTGVFSAIGPDNCPRCFAVKDDDLVEIKPNGTSYTFTVLRAGVGYMDMSFCELNGNYYYTSRAVSGVITSTGIKTFGQAQVNVQPTLTATTGTMPAGTYLVAVTTLDASGMESGTKEPTSIVLAANKQIALSNIYVSTDPRVTSIAIYCSTANGEKLFRQAVIANGTTTANITTVNTHTFPLGKIGTFPAPTGGHLMAYHYGHLYLAVNNFIFYSEPRPSYEQFHPINNYAFTSKITAILPCESGLWVSTERDGFFWINGKTPHQGFNAQGDMQAFKKHSACLLVGSAKLIPAEFIGNGNPTYGWKATAKEGQFLLLDGGQFHNVTQDNINMPELEFCAGAIINDSDSYKYASLMAGHNLPLRTI